MGKSRSYVRIGIVLILSYINMVGLMWLIEKTRITSSGFGTAIFGSNPLSLLCFIVTAVMLNRFFVTFSEHKRNLAGSCIVGFFLAIAVNWGACIVFDNKIVYHSEEDIFRILTTVFLLIFTIPLSGFIFELLDKLEKAINTSSAEDEKKDKKAVWKYSIIVWVIIVVPYVLLFLANWPGNIVFDGPDEIEECFLFFRDGIKISTHHTVAHLLTLGIPYWIGYKISNISLGMSLYFVLQILLCSVAMAYFMSKLYRHNVPRVFRNVLVIIFTINPLYALFAISSTKDVISGALFTIFMTVLLGKVIFNEEFKWYSWCVLLLSGSFACLYRNNMIYAMAAGTIFMAFLIKGKKRKIIFLAALVATMVLVKIENAVLISVTNAETVDSYREALSVPLQCMGRVECYRGSDVPEPVINTINKYINEYSAMEYSPFVADSVKGTANEALLKGDTIGFIKDWLWIGKYYTVDYVEAILSNTLSYWYPFNAPYYIGSDVSTYHPAKAGDLKIDKKVLVPDWLDKFYTSMNAGDRIARKLPIIGYFFRPAPYIWIMAYVLVWAIMRKKREGLAIMAIPFFYFATCLLGPTAWLRYIYPVILTIPVFGVACLRELSD